ncbi:MAG: PilN domain-containing protein [Candidatus Omnitrophica bacterium]|nr:PilN domain-containing protein [Candidatus Omnitrophota bacterium]
MFIYIEKIKEQFALNHFFRAMNVQRYVLRSVLLTLIFIGIVGAGLGIKAWEFYSQTEQIKKDTQAIAAEKQQLKESSQDLYRQRDDFMRVRQGLLDQATFVKNLNRVSWSEVLAVVSEEMPKDLALTSFKFNESGEVSFFGDALDVEVIAELIRKIDTSAILQNGKFDFLSEKVIEKTKIYNFGILAQLQKKASEDAGEIIPNSTQGQEQEQKPSGATHVPDVDQVNHEKTNN